MTATKALNQQEFIDDFQNNPAPKALVDIRNPDETDAGILPGAIVAPLPQILMGTASLPQNTTLYVYCRTGNRVLQAAPVLQAQGFTDLRLALGCGYEDLKSTLK